MNINLNDEILKNVRNYAKDHQLKCETQEEIIYILELMTGFAWNYS